MCPRRTNPAPTVLVLIHGLGIGGAERLISEGSTYWDRESFDYRVAYVLPWKDQLVPELTSKDVPVACIGGRRGLDIRTPWRLRRLLKDWDVDLIHAHLPSAGVLARLSTRKPTVYTEHNLADSYRQPTRTMNRATYRLNRAVIAVSDAVAASTREYPGPSAVVIPNGVSTQLETTNGIRVELGVAEKQPLIVHVGNVRPHKGHDNLIKAASVLRTSHPDARIVSIGADKREGDLIRLRGHAAELGLSGYIDFLGRKPDATSYLAAADIVVNPSDVEGLPVTILEALTLERPVVATRVGGVPSVIEHDVTGYLVPPSDPTALADGLSTALRDPARARRWARNGAELVRARFGIERMVDAYENVYRQVCR